MDLCHLKHTELAKHIQKCIGRVVFRRDNIKDDNGYRAVPKKAHRLHRQQREFFRKEFPMAGEANDAVSAQTQGRKSQALQDC